MKTKWIWLAFVLSAGAGVWYALSPLQPSSTVGMLVSKRDTPFDEVQGADVTGKFKTSNEIMEAEKQKKSDRRHKGYTKPKNDGADIYLKTQRELRTKAGESQPDYAPYQAYHELVKAKQRLGNLRTMQTDWTSRGPSNVPGRTRAVLVLPDNEATWLAGSSAGGIWKTTNRGQSWIDKTPQLPNLATTTLARSGNTIYAGTGEFLGGSVGVNGMGVFKSTDKGETWSAISSTLNDPRFINVNRLITDPNNPNIIVVATSAYNRDRVRSSAEFETKIMRTEDGGSTWKVVFENPGTVWQVVANPNNFNIQYATHEGGGILKSTDAGKTWAYSHTGVVSSGRMEISISPVNADRLYMGTVGPASGKGSDIYTSIDAGQNWVLIKETDPTKAVDHYGGQGWYDNAIVAHPFIENQVYIGGVNLWRIDAQSTITQSRVLQAYSEDTDFLNFVNFSAPYLGGALATNPEFTPDQLLSVEVRFGPGLKQKAHRFIVNKQGAGVPATDYIYKDYVEVPFQVWDTENNRQLMVAFRDQQEDGKFNLIAPNTTAGEEANHSREYIYINKAVYSETASVDMAKNGGHASNYMYQIWGVLADGATWTPDNLPVSKIVAQWFNQSNVLGTTTNLTDAYGQFSKKNPFSTATIRTNEGVHPDQHSLTAQVINSTSKTFRLIVTNDGGVYHSNTAASPGTEQGDWNYAGGSMVTSQFHGVDKMPGKDVYIGGMQDNSVWRSPLNSGATESTLYDYMFAGDGFDVIWHNKDAKKVIGGSQFNDFYRSEDAGVSWMPATSGLSGNGSFYSPLANARTNPDVIFTVSSNGVYRSLDFGKSWKAASIPDGTWYFGGVPQVKVSEAHNMVVWAGVGISFATNENIRMQVSTDGGASFNTVANYDKESMGGISGFATHPTESKTAYAMFAFAKSPKILKTTDLGQTWSDITGFEGTDVSTNGFPDVAVFDLLVMPHNPQMIWVGTEIGIVESTDAGTTWHLLNADLPAVAVYDMKLMDDQVVIGTHGRGIWTTKIAALPAPAITFWPKLVKVTKKTNNNVMASVHLPQPYDSVQVYAPDYIGTTKEQGDFDVTITGLPVPGVYEVYVLAYKNGLPYYSEKISIELSQNPEFLTSYTNFFDATNTDFIGDAFTVKSLSGFDNKALHTAHPYIANQTITYQLKKPIEVATADATVRYQDIAIVEPGAAGSVFGNANFWDYVVVEASSNQIDWTPIEDGYDASADAAWLDAYTNAKSGKTSMFKSHEVDLLKTFSPGDLIYLRFRLFSDQQTVSWGWVIDNLLIQVPNRAPVARNDSYTPNSAQEIGGNLLENDTDADKDILIAKTAFIKAPMHGTATLTASGFFSYKSENGFSGMDSLQYQVCDNALVPKCATATVYLDVQQVLGFDDDIAQQRLAMRVFPNPASQQATLEYYLPMASNAKATLVSLDGKTAREIMPSQLRASGVHSFTLPLTDLPRGIYLLQLSAGDRTQAQRIRLE